MIYRAAWGSPHLLLLLATVSACSGTASTEIKIADLERQFDLDGKKAEAEFIDRPLSLEGVVATRSASKATFRSLYFLDVQADFPLGTVGLAVGKMASITCSGDVSG
jgi:hypothetical protein